MPASVDNGWAWVVCFAATTAYCLSYGTQWSVSIFNVVFLEEFDESSQAVAWICAISNAALYISACLSGILINAIGCRAVLFLSGIITGLGLIASSFAQHIYHLYFSFGISGAGNGLVMLSAMLPVMRRFERKRTIAVGLTSSGCGVGLFLIPVLLEYLLHYYSWRQAILIFGGLTMNLCVCAAACFPIRESSKELLPKTKLLHLSMFKMENYIKLSINNALLSCGLTIEMLVLPAYATIQLKYSSYQSAMLLSLVGISNLIGRLLYGFLASQPKLTSLRLYSISLILLGLFSFCVTFSSTYSYIGTFATILGFLSACYGTLLPLLLLEFVKDKHLNNAYGFLCIYMAIGALAGPPLSGWLYDRNLTYSTSFYLAGVFITASGIIMMIPSILGKSFEPNQKMMYITEINNAEKEQLNQIHYPTFMKECTLTGVTQQEYSQPTVPCIAAV